MTVENNPPWVAVKLGDLPNGTFRDFADIFPDEDEARIETEVRNRMIAQQAQSMLNSKEDELRRMLIGVLRNVDGQELLMNYDDLRQPLRSDEQLIMYEIEDTGAIKIAIESANNDQSNH